MFKFLYRKKLPKDLNEYDLNVYLHFTTDRFKTKLFASYIICFLFIFPIAFIALYQFTIELSLYNRILITLFIAIYSIALITFYKNFKQPIKQFEKSINNLLFFTKYTCTGNALSLDDFKIIQDNNKELFDAISSQKCRSCCLHVCYDILKLLKQGELKFIAIKALTSDKQKEKYTLHILYVNNDWCFDTFSQKQLPFNEFLSVWKAKEYQTFSYADIEGKELVDFFDEQWPKLIEWCAENDCTQYYQKGK